MTLNANSQEEAQAVPEDSQADELAPQVMHSGKALGDLVAVIETNGSYDAKNRRSYKHRGPSHKNTGSISVTDLVTDQQRQHAMYQRALQEQV